MGKHATGDKGASRAVLQHSSYKKKLHAVPKA